MAALEKKKKKLDILENGNLDKLLKDIGLSVVTFEGCVNDVQDSKGKYSNKPRHPRFDELCQLLKQDHDLSEENVKLFMKYMFGEAAVCRSLSEEQARFHMDLKFKFEEALQEVLELTTASRAQYDELEEFILQFLIETKAPRKPEELLEKLEVFFQNQTIPEDDDEFMELADEDLEIFGQLDFLVQQGPQMAILAMKDRWNHAHEEYPDLDAWGTFPHIGQRIANCYWGPVRKHNYKGEYIVSKCINLDKLKKNQKSHQKFNDYPPNEIATHRFLNNYFSYSPAQNHTKCDYIVNLRGVMKDESASRIFYYMDYGTDYFAHISNGYEKALRDWRQMLKKMNKSRQFKQHHIKNNKSPWEIERRKDFLKLAHGLKYMHDLGVTHRDFKLENIVMGLDKNVKIIDFGVAHRYGLWEQEGPNKFLATDRVGTANYMSPECTWSSKKRKGRESIQLDSWDHWNSQANDIWTLGVALFMMLFACPPYDSCSNSDNRFIYLTKGDYIPSDKVKTMKPRNASLRALVKAYKRLDMVTEDCLEFLEGFFKRESSRWTWETMMNHKWIAGHCEHNTTTKGEN